MKGRVMKSLKDVHEQTSLCLLRHAWKTKKKWIRAIISGAPRTRRHLVDAPMKSCQIKCLCHMSYRNRAFFACFLPSPLLVYLVCSKHISHSSACKDAVYICTNTSISKGGGTGGGGSEDERPKPIFHNSFGSI